MTPSEAADAVERAAATVEQQGRRLGMPGRPAVGYEHDATKLRAIAKALREGQLSYLDSNPRLLTIELPDTEQEGKEG